MAATENKIFEILKQISSVKELNISEIPDIDLYMDQITSFMDDKLGSFKRSPEDQVLTKTMINNYTKAKILMPSNKKKYSKDHTLLLVLVYHLKQTLTISDIEKLFLSITSNHKDASELSKYLKNIYEVFTKMQIDESARFSKEFEEKFNSLHNNSSLSDDKSTLLLAVLMLIIQSSLQKRMAERIIDEFFKN